MHLDHRNLPDWDKPSTFLRQQVSTFLQSSYESIANVQEKATLAQFGIEYKDDSDSSPGSSETDSDVDSAMLCG